MLMKLLNFTYEVILLHSDNNIGFVKTIFTMSSLQTMIMLKALCSCVSISYYSHYYYVSICSLQIFPKYGDITLIALISLWLGIYTSLLVLSNFAFHLYFIWHDDHRFRWCITILSSCFVVRTNDNKTFYLVFMYLIWRLHPQKW